NKTGDFYFTCTFQGHCNNGQKLSVKVSASSPAPAQGPSPPSPTPPSSTPPSGTTPTPPSPTPPVNGDSPSPSSP
ncbi:blue copper protein, partial [Trifolium medium]|nr:blue copper protein [Trifolium medium]